MDSSTQQSSKHTAWLLTIGLLALFTVSVFVIRWWRWNQPIAYPTAQIPDAAKYGNVDASIRQCKELYAALNAAEGNWKRVYKTNSNLLYLPDRAMAEESANRSQTISFRFPKEFQKPLYGNVAFWTEIYARKNPAQYRDEVTKNKPGGFYLVCFANGDVKQFPVEDIRIALVPERHSFVPVFPGMKEYDPNAYRLPHIEFADGKVDDERKKALLASLTDTSDCPSCTK